MVKKVFLSPFFGLPPAAVPKIIEKRNDAHFVANDLIALSLDHLKIQSYFHVLHIANIHTTHIL